LFNAGKIMSQCPNKYQSPPHRQNIEILLRLLHDNPQGLYQNDVIDNCNISRNHTIEYLNMLLRIGELVRESRKVRAMSRLCFAQPRRAMLLLTRMRQGGSPPIGPALARSLQGFVYKLHPKHQDPVPSTRPVR
jgi:predicted transcriptional regulator